MRLAEQPLYREDVADVANLELPWEKLQDKSLLISGASGLIGKFLVDVIMERNYRGMNCTIYAVGRNLDKAKDRFQDYWEKKNFVFISQDINKTLEIDRKHVDYVIHMASNTHPVAYATEPIDTIITNVIGTHRLLEFAAAHHAERVVFVSSNEIYGENRGDTELFDESYCGYIDSNTMRAGYPESKRCGEALCQAYKKQKNLDVVIPRLTRSYGPTMLMSDTKAISQFIQKGIVGEDIVLKSKGTQFYSYTYVSDAAAGLLTVLLKGENGEAYNVADSKSDIMLRDLAGIIADISHSKVVFQLPDELEKAGYSVATKARLDGSKIKKLGWSMKYDIREGIERTVRILKNIV